MIVEQRLSRKRLERQSLDDIQQSLYEDYLDEVSLGRVQASPIDRYVYYFENSGDWKPTHVLIRILPVLRETKHKYVIQPPYAAKPKFVDKNAPRGKYQHTLQNARYRYENFRRKEHMYLLMRIERCAKQMLIFQPLEARHMLDEDNHECRGW